MKKLIYNQDGGIIVQIFPGSYCNFCASSAKTCVAANGIYICEDCAAQIKRIAKKYGPIPGQESSEKRVGKVSSVSTST